MFKIYLNDKINILSLFRGFSSFAGGPETH